MAQVTEVRLVDDLDGGDADESVEFTLDNKHYEMDLSEKHAAQLRDALAPFMTAARRAGGSTTTRARRTPSTQTSTARGNTAAIREWAQSSGIEVSARGRIAATVHEAYEHRGHATPTTPAVEAPVVEAPADDEPASAIEAKPKRRSRKKPTETAQPA